VPSIVRSVVTSSWERSAEAGVRPGDHEPPVVWEPEEARERWDAHPLRAYSGLVATLLGDFAHDARHIVVISDADGRLLWSAGHASVLAAAATIGFSPGRNWAEAATGTNGVGTALAVDHPVQIFSAEHYAEQVHAWSCSGAPVHDPETGAVLGVIDVSTGIRDAHPHSLALTAAAARAVEAELWRALVERRERLRARFFERVTRDRRARVALVDVEGRVLAAHPVGWAPEHLDPAGEPFGEGATLVRGARAPRRPGRVPVLPRLRIEALGRPLAAAWLDGAPIQLTPRRSELLVLLALAPDGLSADELARAVYGEEGRRLTVRGEISRLRARLGDVIAANPYHLAAELDADFLRGSDRSGLLPGSVAPGVVAARGR